MPGNLLDCWAWRIVFDQTVIGKAVEWAISVEVLCEGVELDEFPAGTGQAEQGPLAPSNLKLNEQSRCRCLATAQRFGHSLGSCGQSQIGERKLLPKQFFNPAY
jgi:hypothetical protein